MRLFLASCISLLLPVAVQSQTSSPVIQSQYPASNATGVPRNTVILLRVSGLGYYGPPTLKLAPTSNPTAAVQLTTDSQYYSTDFIWRTTAALAASTAYTVTATATGFSHTFQFTTGADVDVAPPKVVSVSPDPTSAPADPAGSFRFLFDKPLATWDTQPTAVDGHGFALDVSARLLDDRRTIEVRTMPKNRLPGTVQVKLDPTRMRDMAWNAGASAPITARYITEIGRDNPGPKLIGQYPAPGDSGVPTNALLQFLFDRPVYEFDLGQAFVLEARGERVPVSAELRSNVVGIRANLLANTTYTLRITNEVYNEFLMPMAEAITFQFTTSTAPAPPANTTVAISPSYTVTNAPTNARIVFRSSNPLPAFMPMLFDESLRTKVPPERRLIGNATLSADRKTLTVVPRGPLPAWSEVAYDLAGLGDILGPPFDSALTFRTGGASDEEAPRVRASTPAAGATEMPPNTPVVVAFHETLGAATPANALRLLRNGEPVEGAVTVSGNTIGFKPARNLDGGAEYTMEAEGVADLAGNVAPKWTATFQVAGTATVPPPAPQVVRSSIESGPPGALDPFEVVFSNPLSPAAMDVSVSVDVPQPETSFPQVFEHPVTVEIAGQTVRVTPLVPWPSGRDSTLKITGADVWTRYLSYSVVFRARATDDTTRPEVVSMTPAPGTPLRASDVVQLTFSEPMVNGSAYRGLRVMQAEYNALRATSWSDDRRTLTLVLSIPNTVDGVLSAPIVVVASDAMTDLAGNPLRTVVARYPLAEQRIPTTLLPRILTRLPKTAALDPAAPLNLLFSGLVDAAALNRAVWLLSGNGRVTGTWQTSGDGSIATFWPDRPWPAGPSVRLFAVETLLDLTYEFSFTTAPAAVGLSLLRTSVYSDSHPANAVLDFEFDREPPAGATPIKLMLDNAPLAFDQARPRARVLRLTPKTALRPGSYLQIVGEGLTFAATSYPVNFSAKIAAAVPGDAVEVPRRSPLPNSTGVPRNARVSLLASGPINLLSITPETMRITSGGRTIGWSLDSGSSPTGPIRIVPNDLLPSDATIEVRIDGLEDRMGRPVAVSTWTFRTASGVDLKQPKVLYTNIPLSTSLPGFDPTAAFRTEYDEPIEAASIASYEVRDNPATIELSEDLRTITVRPLTSWRRGLDVSASPGVCDLAGNCIGGWSSVRAGFDPATTPLVLREASMKDGQTAVPVNVRFALLFDRPIGSDALRAVRLMRGSEQIPLTGWTATQDGRVTFGPDTPLDPNTAYEWVIEGLTDASGNALSNPRTVRFTTGEQYDVSSPTARLRSMSKTTLRVAVSEPLDLTSLATIATPLTRRDTRLGQVAVPADVVWSEERLELTHTAKNDLAPGVEYSVNVAELRDLAGLRSGVAVTATPIENPDANPVKVTFQPPDGSTGVPTNAGVYVSYSRGVVPGAVRLYQDGVLVATTTPPNAAVTRTSPAWQLRPSTEYRMESDGFRDVYDMEIPAASATFTTGAGSDGTSLTLVSTSPANNEAGVPPSTPWQFTFNKPLSPISVFLEGIYSTRQMPFRTTTSVDREKLTIAATPMWPAASTISTTLYPVGRYGVPTVTDWAGNRLRLQTTVTFRTAAINEPDAPVLEAAFPPSGTTIPGGESTVTLRFSKPVMITDDGLQIYYGAERVRLSGVYGSVGVDMRTLTYTLSPPENSRVTIVGTADIRDNADNPGAPFVLEYPTGERLPSGSPRCDLVEPKPSVTIPANSTFMIRFDRPMVAETVQQAFRVTQNGENVAGTMAVLEDGRAFRFTPSAPLPAGAAVRIFVLPVAVDLQGQKMYDSNPYDRMFTVEGGTRSFQVVQRSFDGEAPADAILEVEFDREVDRASVHGETVWLRKGSRLVAGHAALRDDRVVQFVPDVPLEVGAEYVLTAGAALRSLDGAEFRGQDMRFRATAAAASPEVEAIEFTTVGGRDAVRVRFSGALSRLVAGGIALLRDGRAVEHTALRSVDGRAIVLVPREREAGDWSVSIDRVQGRNGRPIAPGRMTVAGRIAQ
jgi:hypothetical protein